MNAISEPAAPALAFAPRAAAEESPGELLVKVADRESEIEAAMRLRAEVFSAEYGTAPSPRDEDLFDAYCRHLVVIHRPSGRVVGTYRMQDDFAALHGAGFYSETEFDLTMIKRHGGRLLELGRSCIAPEFRDGRVIHLLFAGIAAEAARLETRFILGCPSLPIGAAPDAPAIAAALLAHYGADSLHLAPVRPAYAADLAPAPAVDETVLLEKLPPLMKAYLRLGARVCGGPALDREFRSVDFLMLLPVEKLARRYRRHFFRGGAARADAA